MITGLDSSIDRPSAATADQARGQGIGLWSGYLSILPPGPGGSGLEAQWSKADFDAARRCGGTPVGFCSGWDDPIAIRLLARAWNVRACLDDEVMVRPDGPWVQPWLDASGAGLYGLLPVHAGRTAAFHIAALYPVAGCPGSSWPNGSPPAAPHGWQCQGTHSEFGLSVDRGVYDDWFGGRMLTLSEKQQIVLDWYQLYLGRGNPTEAEVDSWTERIADDGSDLRKHRDDFYFTPEAQAWVAKQRAVVTTGVAAHIHSVTGATGPPQ